MEEKRTPITIAEGILDNIFSIAEKFINGLTSLGKKDISEQLTSFAETLKQIPEGKRSLKSDEAEAFLKEWTRRCAHSGLYPFEQLARRLNRWKEGILAYFDYPITNAVSEGINNKIKVLKRRSYGFHDFHYFLLKIMNATGALPQLQAMIINNPQF